MQINQAMYVGTCKFFHGIFHYQTTMLPIWTLSLQTSSGNAVEFLQGYVHFYMLSYMLLTLKRTGGASHLLNMQELANAYHIRFPFLGEIQGPKSWIDL